MKRLISLLAAFTLGAAVSAVVVKHLQTARHTREIETLTAAWEGANSGKAAASKRPASSRLDLASGSAFGVEGGRAMHPDPANLLNRLVALPVSPGQGPALRQVISLLDQIASCGEPALPAIRQFLATFQDTDYETTSGRGIRDVRSMATSLVPRSLRFGLFDAVRQIGGPEAERILVESLQQTGAGIEIAYLTELLEDIAPGRHRDTALDAAKGLLAGGQVTERMDRDYLFSVLRRFNDASFVATAQSQLIQGAGLVDRGALRYLQHTLGEQALPIVAQAYADGRLTDPDSREPLARVALNYVGASDQALQLFHTAVLDQSLKPDQRRNLIEDLNEDGLANRRSPTPADLQIIARRYQLTQTYLRQDFVQNDKVLFAAFKEADKDLRNMLQRAEAAANAQPVPGR